MEAFSGLGDTQASINTIKFVTNSSIEKSRNYSFINRENFIPVVAGL